MDRLPLPTREQATDYIDAAFNNFGEARRTLTETEFKKYIRDSILTLGGQGFVRSIGQMISIAAEKI